MKTKLLLTMTLLLLGLLPGRGQTNEVTVDGLTFKIENGEAALVFGHGYNPQSHYVLPAKKIVIPEKVCGCNVTTINFGLYCDTLVIPKTVRTIDIKNEMGPDEKYGVNRFVDCKVENPGSSTKFRLYDLLSTDGSLDVDTYDFWIKVPKGCESNYSSAVSDYSDDYMIFSEEKQKDGVVYRVNHFSHTAIIAGYTAEFATGAGVRFNISNSFTDESGMLFDVTGIDMVPNVETLILPASDKLQFLRLFSSTYNGNLRALKNLIIQKGLKRLYGDDESETRLSTLVIYSTDNFYMTPLRADKVYCYHGTYDSFPPGYYSEWNTALYVPPTELSSFQQHFDNVYPIPEEKKVFESWLCPGLKIRIDEYLGFAGAWEEEAAWVTGYDSELPENVIIPSTWAGLKVRGIDENAFMDCNTIKSVTFPSTFLEFRDNAFKNCTSLESVYFSDPEDPDKTDIPPIINVLTGAFEGCTSLKELRNKESNTLPNLQIQDRAFYGTTALQSLDDVQIIEYIGRYAFANSSLKSLVLHNVEKIPHYPVTDHLTIDEGAFSNSQIQRFSLTLESDESTFDLGKNAFSECNRLMEFEYKGSGLRIGEMAFVQCSKLKRISITEPIISIGDYAFESCSSLENVNLCPKIDYNSTSTIMGEGIFGNCVNLKKLALPFTAVISKTYTIGHNLSKLEELIMPYFLAYYSGSSIPVWAFHGLNWSADYKIVSHNPTPFPDNAFAYETYQNITLKVPSNSISEYRECEGWRNFVHIEAISDEDYYKVMINDVEYSLNPNTWTATVTGYNQEFVGYYVDFIPQYTTRYIYEDVPWYNSDGTLGGYVYSIVGTETIQTGYMEVETPLYNTYESLTLEPLINWNGSTYTVKKIADEAFKDCQILKQLTIPSGYVSIGKNAFTGSSLEEVYLNCKLDYMNDDEIWTGEDGTVSTAPFFQCDKLTKATVLSNTYSIPDYLFYGASALKDVSLNMNTQIIGYAAFAYSGIESIQLPDNVTYIYSSAFKNSQLKEIGLPQESLISMSPQCFSGTPLKELYIPSSMQLIGDNDYSFLDGADSLRRVVFAEDLQIRVLTGFANKSKLEEVVLPSSVQGIGMYAFKNCTSLVSVNLPEGLKSIYDGAFQMCSSLEEIKFPSTLESIQKYAFEGTHLQSLSLPENLDYVGFNAFAVVLDDENKTNYDHVITYAPVPPERWRSKLVMIPNGIAVPPLYVPLGCRDAYVEAWGDEFTDIREFKGSEFIVSSEETTTARGATVKIPVDMFNVNEAVGVMFDVSMPKGVELAKNNSGNYIATLADRTTDHQIIINKLSNGEYRFIVLSLTSQPISGYDGNLLTMTLNVSPTASAGDFELLFHNTQVVAYSGNTVCEMTPGDGTSPFIILDEVVGNVDASSDNKITLLDVIVLLRHINRIQLIEPLNMAVTDVMSDGVIDLLDALQLLKILSEQPSGANTSVFDGEAVVEAAPVSGGIDISVSSETCTALSMDITLPEGVTLDGVALDASRRADHSVRLTDLGGGRYRAIVWSASSADLKGTSGCLLHLETSMTPTTVRIDGIEIGTNDLRLLSARPVDGYTTGIGTLTTGLAIGTDDGTLVVTSDRDASVTVVGTDGRLVRRFNVGPGTSRHQGFAPGVYLVNGERVIIK